MGLLSRLFHRSEPADQRRAWLDQAVRGAALRVQDRMSQHQQRSFAAAETPAWTDSWPTHASELNEDLSRQLPTLRSRARGHAQDNEWARRYLIQLKDNVLGAQGIRLQMRVKRGDGSNDDATNARLESGWSAFGRRGVCDVSGRYTWQEIEALALESLARDGELLYRHVLGAGPHGYQIQLLNSALLDVDLNRTWEGRRIRMGVEITDEGRPVAYWLRVVRTGDTASDLIAVGRHVRVPAGQIRHYFEAEEPDQLRGYPWISTGARRLWLLNDFEEAAAVASSNAAKRQGFFVSPTGDAPPGFADTVVSEVLEAARAAGKELTAEEIRQITQAAQRYTTTMPGRRVGWGEPANPNNQVYLSKVLLGFVPHPNLRPWKRPAPRARS